MLAFLIVFNVSKVLLLDIITQDDVNQCFHYHNVPKYPYLFVKCIPLQCSIKDATYETTLSILSCNSLIDPHSNSSSLEVSEEDTAYDSGYPQDTPTNSTHEKHAGFHYEESDTVQLKHIIKGKATLKELLKGFDKHLLNYVSAFENHQRGNVYFGIYDDGMVKGQVVKSEDKKMEVKQMVEKIKKKNENQDIIRIWGKPDFIPKYDEQLSVEFVEMITAFANHQDGNVYFGIYDDGMVKGQVVESNSVIDTHSNSSSLEVSEEDTKYDSGYPQDTPTNSTHEKHAGFHYEESDTVQLKLILKGKATLKELLKGFDKCFLIYVSAFANHQGGNVYFGIHDNGTVKGQVVESEDEKMEVKQMVEKMNRQNENQEIIRIWGKPDFTPKYYEQLSLEFVEMITAFANHQDGNVYFGIYDDGMVKGQVVEGNSVIDPHSNSSSFEVSEEDTKYDSGYPQDTPTNSTHEKHAGFHYEESDTVQLKLILKGKATLKELLKGFDKCFLIYVSAFVNHQGGNVYFGIHDDGTVKGQVVESEDEKMEVQQMVEKMKRKNENQEIIRIWGKPDFIPKYDEQLSVEFVEMITAFANHQDGNVSFGIYDDRMVKDQVVEPNSVIDPHSNSSSLEVSEEDTEYDSGYPQDTPTIYTHEKHAGLHYEESDTVQLKLIIKGKGTFKDFHKGFDKHLLNYVSAFANHQGGNVYFGIYDDGMVKGQVVESNSVIDTHSNSSSLEVSEEDTKYDSGYPQDTPTNSTHEKHAGFHYEESDTVQLKLILKGKATLKELLKGFDKCFLIYVSAFANHQGGNVYFGIHDNGTVKGQVVESEDEKMEVKQMVEKMNRQNENQEIIRIWGKPDFTPKYYEQLSLEFVEMITAFANHQDGNVYFGIYDDGMVKGQVVEGNSVIDPHSNSSSFEVSEEDTKYDSGYPQDTPTNSTHEKHAGFHYEESDTVQLKLILKGKATLKELLKGFDKCFLIYVSAFGNHQGGNVYFGIHDNGTVKGQVVESEDEKMEVKQMVEKMNRQNENQEIIRIWGKPDFTPKYYEQLSLEFVEMITAFANHQDGNVYFGIYDDGMVKGQVVEGNSVIDPHSNSSSFEVSEEDTKYDSGYPQDTPTNSTHEKHAGFHYEESDTVQLKLILKGKATLKELLKGFDKCFLIYVSAFANHQGGNVYFGIHDNGTVKGQVVESEDEKMEVKQMVEKMNRQNENQEIIRIWGKPDFTPKYYEQLSLEFVEMITAFANHQDGNVYVGIYDDGMVKGQVVEGNSVIDPHSNSSSFEVSEEDTKYDSGYPQDTPTNSTHEKHAGFHYEESDTVQLKLILKGKATLKELLKGFDKCFLIYVSAFANHQGGNVYFGIHDNGTVKGQVVESEDEKMEVKQMVEKMNRQNENQEIIRIWGKPDFTPKYYEQLSLEFVEMITAFANHQDGNVYFGIYDDGMIKGQVVEGNSVIDPHSNSSSFEVSEEDTKYDSGYPQDTPTNSTHEKHAGFHYEESDTVQLKLILKGKATLKELLKGFDKCFLIYVSAFVNHQGGNVYFGIHDDGTVKGQVVESEDEKMEVQQMVEKMKRKNENQEIIRIWGKPDFIPKYDEQLSVEFVEMITAFANHQDGNVSFGIYDDRMVKDQVVEPNSVIDPHSNSSSLEVSEEDTEYDSGYPQDTPTIYAHEKHAGLHYEESDTVQLKLIIKGKGTFKDFHKGFDKHLLNYVSAFANHQGGNVYFGIYDDGMVKGQVVESNSVIDTHSNSSSLEVSEEDTKYDSGYPQDTPTIYTNEKHAGFHYEESDTVQLKLIIKGKGTFKDFHKGFDKRLLNYVSAFANHQGGNVYFGIYDDRMVKGEVVEGNSVIDTHSNSSSLEVSEEDAKYDSGYPQDTPTNSTHEKHAGFHCEESDTVQLKLILNGKDTLKELLKGFDKYFLISYVSAFANHQGGNVYFGIHDNGTVKGQVVESEDEKMEVKQMVEKMNRQNENEEIIRIWGKPDFIPKYYEQSSLEFVEMITAYANHQDGNVYFAIYDDGMVKDQVVEGNSVIDPHSNSSSLEVSEEDTEYDSGYPEDTPTNSTHEKHAGFHYEESDTVQLKLIVKGKATLKELLKGSDKYLLSNISKFANHQGGNVYFGIHDNGTVKGQVVESEDEKMEVKQMVEKMNRQNENQEMIRIWGKPDFIPKYYEQLSLEFVEMITAFANHQDGNVYFGIYDDGMVKDQVVEGNSVIDPHNNSSSLEVSEEDTKYDSGYPQDTPTNSTHEKHARFHCEESDIVQLKLRIWGKPDFILEYDKQWFVKFVEMISKAEGDERCVVGVKIKPFPGGIFLEAPLSWNVDESSKKIFKMDCSEWRNRHTSDSGTLVAFCISLFLNY